MAEIQRITEDKIIEVIADTGFNYDLILKDYYVTVILYLLRDVKDLYFKGGTALHKIFLNYARLSEDIDLTVISDVKGIKKKIEELLTESKFFTRITESMSG